MTTGAVHGSLHMYTVAYRKVAAGGFFCLAGSAFAQVHRQGGAGTLPALACLQAHTTNPTVSVFLGRDQRRGSALTAGRWP